MKKILGVSFAAMLAVSPMMANAAVDASGTAGTITAAVAAENNADLTTVATTNYVKGAYNAIATEHNKVVNDMTVENGTYNYIGAGADVAENLKALDTAVKTLEGTASGAYVTKTSAAATSTNHYAKGDGEHVGANLDALDAQVYLNTQAIADEELRATTAEGNLSTAISNEATARGDADTALSGRIGTIAEDGAYIKDSEEKNVSQNLELLDTGLSDLATTVSNLNTTMTGNFATQAGAAATVNAATVAASGTVQTAQTWGSDTQTPLTVSTTGTVSVDGYHAN